MSDNKKRNFFVLLLISFSAAIIYQVPYLKYVFYDALIETLGVTNAELGELSAIYGGVAMWSYFFGGIIADKVRVKTLYTFSMIVCGGLILWYSTLPSFNTLRVIFALMGVFSIFTFWGARQKVVRLLSTEDSYSTNQGISSGLYGGGSMLAGFVAMYIIGQAAATHTGVVGMLIYYGVACIALGIASWFFIPSFENEITKGKPLLSFDELKEAVKLPIVWLVTISVFSVYALYVSISYTTPYLTNIYGASEVLVAGISTFRSYGIMLFAAPMIGVLARKIGSTARTIVYASIIAIVCVVLFLVLPKEASLLIPVVALTMIAAFFIGGAYGIYFAQLGDGKLPVHIFGAATGIVSIIGFIPDVFIHPMVGGWLDTYPGLEGYNYVFYMMIGFAIVSILASSAIMRQLFPSWCKPEGVLNREIIIY